MSAMLPLIFAIATLRAPDPAKWRISVRPDSPVVASSPQRAKEKAQRLAAAHGITTPLAEPVIAGETPSVSSRAAEELSDELLVRLDALSSVKPEEPAAVRDAAHQALERFRASKPAIALNLLNDALRQIAMERSINAYLAQQQPGQIGDAALFADPHPTSDIVGLPTSLRVGYIVLLERLEGLRAYPAQVGSREATLRRLAAGFAVRLVLQSAKAQSTGVTISYHLVVRAPARSEVAVVDQWKKVNGQLVLKATKATSLGPEGYAASASKAILADAKEEALKIKERLERQKQEMDRRIRERQEAERAERERIQKEEEAKRIEQEKRDREERERREAEEKQRLLDGYRRDLEQSQNDLVRARSERDDAVRSLNQAGEDQQRAGREVGPLQDRVNSLKSEIRGTEQMIEQLKNEGKSPRIQEEQLRELKDQLRGAEHSYNQAKSRRDAAEQEVYNQQRRISDLDDLARRLRTTIDQLRFQISSLGG